MPHDLRMSAPADTPQHALHSHLVVVFPDRPARPCEYFRRLLEGQLGRLGLLTGEDGPYQRRSEEVLLVAGELVGNACRHSAGPTRLASHWQPATRRLTLSVSDSSPQMPRLTPPEDRGADGGYGVLLLEILCEGWTVTPHGPGGKTVSATVDFPP